MENEHAVYLRVLEPEDIDRVYRWHNDQKLYRDLVSTHHFVSRATVEKWLDQKGSFLDHELNLAICLKENSLHIGNVYLREINWVDRNCSSGFVIGEADHRGKGYGRQALRLLFDYAFLTLGLNRIYGYVFESNKASLRLCESVGYVVEGKLRKHVYKEGQFWDLLLVGACREDWERCRNK
jgi:RimJ/RimL family protein N-acetyltransferase